MTDTVSRRDICMTLAMAPLVAVLPAGFANAQAYPSKPVRFILPFGAGGVADVTSRLTAEKLGDKLGQRFVVENQPGAGGINAVRTVLGAAPDGYTLGLVTNGTAISVPLFKALPFDPIKEFALISTLGAFDLVFVVNADSPIRTLQDFVKTARERPGKLNVGTINIGSTQNLGAELFKSMAGVNVQIVPYKASPDIVVALLRNDVQMLVEFPPAVKGQVTSGELRTLASSSPQRTALNKDTPTVAESGVPGFEVTSWNGVFAPKGTPKEAVDTMRAAIQEAVASPEIKEAFAKVGVEAKSSSADELMKRLTTDIKKWDDVMKKAGIEKK
jgi:tripartite-type tricarboxylate transporter receptor subunit TctC